LGSTKRSQARRVGNGAQRRALKAATARVNGSQEAMTSWVKRLPWVKAGVRPANGRELTNSPPRCLSRRKSMPDDLTNRGPQDRSRISLLEPHEVQYWADKFNVSKERLSEAVRKVGHSADAVERELKRLA
jgi:Protein of unknown function (DUF3606)